MRLWLEMRTTLAPEDAERYAGAFVEDGAASLDLLVNAGYNKEVQCVGGLVCGVVLDGSTHIESCCLS